MAGGRAKLVGAGMISEPLMAQHLADRETLAAAHTARAVCGYEGAAARGEASGTVLEAVANTGAPPVLHRLERPLHLHPANDEWSLLRALLYDNGRRSEWASRQLHSRHPSDGSVNS